MPHPIDWFINITRINEHVVRVSHYMNSTVRRPTKEWTMFPETVLCFQLRLSCICHGVWCIAMWTWYFHDNVIKWKYCPRYWRSVRGIHRLLVNSTHNGQWRGALMSSLIFAWTNTWVNNRDVGDQRRHRVHYHVTVMCVYVTKDLKYCAIL